MASELDLSHLTEEERAAIEAVLRRDDDFRQEVNARCRATKEKIYKLRKIATAKANPSGSSCSRCQSELGMIFSRGSVCPECNEVVCGKCQRNNEYGDTPPWCCSYCMLQKKAKFEAGEWFFGTNPDVGNYGSDAVRRSIRPKGAKKHGKRNSSASNIPPASSRPTNYQPPGEAHKKRKKSRDIATVPLVALAEQDVAEPTPGKSDRKRKRRAESHADTRAVADETTGDTLMHIGSHGQQPSLDINLTPPTPLPTSIRPSYASEYPETKGQVSLAEELQQAEGKSIVSEFESVQSSSTPVIKSQAEKPEEAKVRSGEDEVPMRRRSNVMKRSSAVIKTDEQQDKPKESATKSSPEEKRQGRPSDRPSSVDSPSAPTAVDDSMPFRSRLRSGAVLSAAKPSHATGETSSGKSTGPETGKSSSPAQETPIGELEERERTSTGGFRRRGRVIKRRRDTNQSDGGDSFKSKGPSSIAETEAQATSQQSDRQSARQRAVARAKQRRQQQEVALPTDMPIPVTAYTDDGWEVIDQEASPSKESQPAGSAQTSEVNRSSSTVQPRPVSQSPSEAKDSQFDDSVSFNEPGNEFQVAKPKPAKKPVADDESSEEEETDFDVDSYFTQAKGKSTPQAASTASSSKTDSLETTPRKRTSTFGSSDRLAVDNSEDQRSRSSSLSVGRRFTGGLKRQSSTDSVYSIGAKSENLVVQGGINFHLQYKKGVLHIRIISCEDLAKPKADALPHVYVKSYLLPDRSKSSKRKTSTQKPTLSPKFNEELTYKMDEKQLRRHVLSLTVWDSQILGYNTFLGGIRMELASVNLADSSHSIQLSDQAHTDSLTTLDQPMERGKISLSLRLSPMLDKKKKGSVPCKLEVLFKLAKGISAGDPDNLADPFVKCYLLPDVKTNRKTAVVKNTLEPHWQETLTFENLTLEDMQHRVLELTIWDYDRITSNEFIGAARIGLVSSKVPVSMGTSDAPWRDCTPEESKVWEQAMQQPNQWVDCWLALRNTSSR